MKLLISIILFLSSCSILAQVGINTTNPTGIFHIDAGVAGNIEDDVLITNQGYIGVGTDIPTTRLDIRANSIVKGFSMADGNESVGKALMSDEFGNGTWRNVVNTWSASLSNGNVAYNNTEAIVPIPFTDSYLSISGVGEVNPAGGTITVPYAGMYRFRIAGICSNNRMPTGSTYIAYFRILTSPDVGVFSPHCTGVVGVVDVSVGFYGFIKLPANAKLIIYLNQESKSWANKISNAVFMVDFMY